MAQASGFWANFRHWRRLRPFWGGLFLLLAGLELFFSANMTLGDLQVHLGPQGFLSYLLPLILILCALLCWFSPAQRLFYGILGLLTALYSLLGLNFGGFFLGMLLGVVGGALVVAWGPPRIRNAAAAAPAADETPDEEDEAAAEPVPADAQTQFLPGFDDPEPPAPPATGSGLHRKAFVIALAPLLATAGILAAGSHTPARADDTCPAGLPSRSATATTAPPKTLKKSATPKKPTTGSTAEKPSSSAAPAPAASSAAPAADDPESDHPVLDGITNGVSNLVDGVGKLLGLGDPAPSASPSESPSGTPPATPAPSSSSSAPAPSTPAPSGSPAPPGSASPSPTPTSTDIPCLGPRVLNKVASPDDLPVVSAHSALLETDRLTMYDSTYDGVTALTTATGTIRALKFSMTKSTNKPFKLTVPETGDHTTLIKSNELTISGDVRFYTPRFEGKLFGIIPVVFTPESPPPLTLAVLWFTDVKIDLAFVRADTLHADPLGITEPG